MSDIPDREAVAQSGGLPQIDPPVANLPTLRILHWGMALWVVVLLVVLVVPALREGDRHWWVWVPVAGLSLGALGHIYLARGRGNAADA
ncbi:DUF2530 domain-containing protein [Ornithinimicrobium faecis]|uniref:DUF2530 domain-containing protein n=1 Tax=Ornithinimicrobium faecis TaxID=2934158 RepID=UPI0021191A0E|nr:DUF2530 domain-containing protein [Ornithinimicrobium sp. HY1745]